MRVNPGGQIAPQDVIGRDQLIQKLWTTLEHQSLVLSAERRMGKTCIVRKMVAESPPALLPIYRDLEGIRTPLEFTKVIFDDVEKHLSRSKKIAVRARDLLSQLTNVEIGKWIKFPAVAEPHWKPLLELCEWIEPIVEAPAELRSHCCQSFGCV